jgi:hypothetical protein
VRIDMEPVGRWGSGLLIVTGLAGVALGIHGWSARHEGSVPVSLASPGASPSVAPSPRPSATPSASKGPLLKSMPYASYAFQIYPGSLSAQARQALAGLTVKIRRQGAQISVTTAVNGGPTSRPYFYPVGYRVYIVESALGDDAANSDYNLGDDGLVVTDPQGRIVR